MCAEYSDLCNIPYHYNGITDLPDIKVIFFFFLVQTQRIPRLLNQMMTAVEGLLLPSPPPLNLAVIPPDQTLLAMDTQTNTQTQT
jgi:hypothetical protein